MSVNLYRIFTFRFWQKLEFQKATQACAFCFWLSVSRLFASDTSPKWIDREGLGKRRPRTRLACVASVSVEIDRGKGFSVLPAREMKREPTPPRYFTCAIFRAVFDSCSSFFAPKPHRNARKLWTVLLLAGMNRLQEKRNLLLISVGIGKIAIVTIERADLRTFYPYCPGGVISPWRASKPGLPTSSGFSPQCVK